MKNTKKLTSLFAALAMTAQVGISTPLVMAEDAVVEETPAATKLGLIHTFDGVEGDWTVPTGLAETVIPAVSYSEEGVEPNYATFSATGTWNGSNSDTTSPYVLADLGDDKIKFEDDKTIVFETRLKFTGLEESTNRIKLGYNLPASDIAKFKLYDKVNANAAYDYQSNMGDSHLFEFIDEADKFTAIRYGVGTYWSSAGKWQASEAEPVDGQWLKVVVHVNPGFVFDYYLYDEDGNKLFEKTAQAMSYVTNSEYFENVALIMTHNNYVASADVDYVKVYNLPTEVADNYADYTTSFDEVTLSDVKVDGVLIDEVKEATEGKVTFSADGDVSVANISYTMLTGNKETVTVEDYVYENNTITFPDGLVEKATYTITLDKGNGMKESISFNSPWTDKIGLIYNQEAETNTDWILGNKITEAEVSSEGYKKYLPTVSNDIQASLRIPMGDNKIKFVDDKVIVIETKIKATKNTAIDASKNSRLSLVYNAGIDVEDSDNAIAIENNKTKQAYSVGFNHSVLMQLYEGVAASTFDIGYANGSYDGASTYNQTKLAWAGGLKANTLDGNNEYTLIAKLDKNHNSGEIIIEKDGTKIAEKTVADLGWVTASDYLENVAFNSIVNPFESFEVDYVKVYNVPKAEKDDYKKFDGAYDEVYLSNIKVDGVAIDKADDVKTGTVTFDSTADVTVKEVYYSLLKGDNSKVAVTDYEFADNTVTFPNGLTKVAKYTVVIDLGNCITEEITFNSEWINPTGLILDLDGTETDAWKVATGTSSTVAPATDEDGTTYAHMTVAAKNNYMLAKLPEDGIKYKDDETIIIDTRIRGKNINSSNDARLQIKWNMPEVSGTSFNLKYNGTTDLTGGNRIKGDAVNGFTTAYDDGANHLAIGEFAKTWIRFSNGNVAWSGTGQDNRYQNNWKNVNTAANAQDNKWFRVIIKMNKGFNMEYVVYNEANEVVYSETGKIHWVEASDFLKNITMFSFLNAAESIDVDYLKIYNIEKGTEDNFKVNGTIDGVDIREVKRVDVNKAEISVETEYDVNDAVISYTAWDGTAGTLVNGEDYIVTEVGNNKYEIEFTEALKRSASYTIYAGENADFGFETELDPQTLYYDGFANATSLEDWKMIYSWSGAIDGFPNSYYTPSDYERMEVKGGKLVVIGDSNADILNHHPDRYGKLAASKMYEYQNGKDWKDYEFKFTYKTDLETQLNVVARHKTSLDPKNGIVSHGVSTRHYVKYGGGGTERLYFGNMTGIHPQPMQGGSNVAEYDKAYNNTEKYPELKGSQKKYETTLQLGNRYETTIKVLGNSQYFAVKGLDDD